MKGTVIIELYEIISNIKLLIEGSTELGYSAIGAIVIVVNNTVYTKTWETDINNEYREVDCSVDFIRVNTDIFKRV